MLSQTIALKRIADCITDIDIENLSKAESQIGRILKDEGIVVEKENNGETCYIIKGLADSAIALGDIPPIHDMNMDDVPEEIWEYAKALHSANPKRVFDNIKAIRATFNLGLKVSKMILDKVRGF